MTFDLPLYHIFRIYQKARSGQDITWDDLARLYGTPTYQFMKILDQNAGFPTLSKVYSRGQRYIDKVPFRVRTIHEATNKAYPRRYSRGRGWRSRSYYKSRSRRYRS